MNAAYGATDLDTFSATEFETLLERFRRLDRQQQEYAKVAIQHEVTKHYPRMSLEYAENSEQVFLRREINKSRRHKPLRTLFREIPNLATTLKPCFMMSPLSVAQYVEYGTIHFDTVIFDEASQVMPQDAVSSLIRADQTVIAGDTKQLPPTTFFDADVSSGEDVPEDLESILDEAASVLPERRLLWHYRSNTNDLIEFSNQKYYDGRLMTFPENDRDSDTKGVQFDYVEDGLYDRGGASTNVPEARRVVDNVEAHVEDHPEKSLGVVAFSSAQADAIREEIERRRDTAPELASFVDHDDTLEGFFVKSLENVQGDERDMLIFSVGYGPDDAGKITMNFGPLNHTGGERRLNVAVTRARDRITVVSSITHDDIDLSRTGSRGVRDFKHYLEYAEKGDLALAREDTTTATLQFDSSFEEAVYTALEEEGFDVDAQVRSAGYSIDLAIKHPDKPGRYVLGIECDGAAYHSSKTARDRDRTRQAVLEDLGWTIHRIWSPDWASNQRAEIDEIAEKVQQRIDGDWTERSTMTATEPDVVEIDPQPMDSSELGEYQDDIVDYEEPSVSRSKFGDYNDATRGKKGGALMSVVDKYGPIEVETAQRETVRAWGVSRLGKNIRSDIQRVTRWSHRKGVIEKRDGFLWPSDTETVLVRTNTDDASRSIDSIPLEELAKAGYILLENGGRMSADDVVVEVARLYGYSRTGRKIESRIEESVDLLRERGAVEPADSGLLQSVDCDVDDRLL